ncbi:hypothetical protein [uncultured Chryseobacterium sp.]|uniref:hypothetical protein n=1 Tax=uncultured Chryseobacterium sp. TaxID=259322 RepID=UPI0025CFD684|nr:hypothetical protein [uncultured Chryseobacterium sp.]
MKIKDFQKLLRASSALSIQLLYEPSIAFVAFVVKISPLIIRIFANDDVASALLSHRKEFFLSKQFNASIVIPQGSKHSIRHRTGQFVSGYLSMKILDFLSHVF